MRIVGQDYDPMYHSILSYYSELMPSLKLVGFERWCLYTTPSQVIAHFFVLLACFIMFSMTS